MSYKVIPSFLFLEQTKELEVKTLKILKQKKLILKNNPYHFKKLKHKKSIFRIRFKDKGKEKRLVYEIEDKIISLLFILDRKKDYKDLERFLEKVSKY
tara:strand:+ start:1722 stop:2015 length:294 start_codon:yes stop_codon:yes gene_type:complete